MTEKSTINLISVPDVHAAPQVGNIRIIDVRPSFDTKQKMEKCSG